MNSPVESSIPLFLAIQAPEFFSNFTYFILESFIDFRISSVLSVEQYQQQSARYSCKSDLTQKLQSQE